MLNKKALIIANSVYQLMTAVHIKRTIIEDCETDLIVTDITPQLKETAPRLKETGLFTRVIFGVTQELNRKYAGAKEEGLSEGFQNIDRIFRFALDEELADYTAIYFANFDPFVRMLACHFYDRPCAFIWYEDGFSSYVIDYLREDRAPINRHPVEKSETRWDAPCFMSRVSPCGAIICQTTLCRKSDGTTGLSKKY